MPANSNAVSARVYTVPREAKKKDSPTVAGDNEHNLRNGYVPDNVDQSRTHLNTTWGFKDADELEADCLEKRLNNIDPNAKRKPKKIRSDAALAVAGIITFGHEAQPKVDAMTYDEQERLYNETARRVAEELNTELTGLAIHRDEEGPHAHYQLLAYDNDGKPVSKKLTKGRCEKLQDIAAEVYQDYGIERGRKLGQRIKDGDSYRETTHRSVKELWQDLPREKAQMQAKLDETQAKLDDTEERLKMAEKRAEQAEKRAEIAESRYNRLRDATKALASNFKKWLGKVVKSADARLEAQQSASYIDEIDYPEITDSIKDSAQSIEQSQKLDESQRITSKIKPK